MFYAFGIPAVAMYLLWKNKHKLDTTSFRERYAFLYDGYDVTVGKGRCVRVAGTVWAGGG